MEKDIQLGPEDKAFLKIEGGKVIFGNEYAGKQVSASAMISADIDQFASLLKAAIPGKIDDTIIDLLVAAMKAI